jgi:hypothetical protein
MTTRHLDKFGILSAILWKLKNGNEDTMTICLLDSTGVPARGVVPLSLEGNVTKRDVSKYIKSETETVFVWYTGRKYGRNLKG